MLNRFLLFCLFCTALFADDVSLPTINVKDASSSTDLSSFDEKDIERLSLINGSLKRILQNIAGVQLGTSSFDIKTLYDLRPLDFSVTGGKFYDNYFGIDGFDTTNRNDPTKKENTISDIPQTSQSFFIDTAQIQSIDVYKSNIPAKFGGFGGGVVDVKTKTPKKKFFGNVFYGKSTSKWAKFIIIEPKNAKNKATYEPPVFERERLGTFLSIPILDGASLSLVHSRSKTPGLSLREMKDKRQNLLSLTSKVKISKLDLGLNYMKFFNDSFLPDVKDSNFFNSSQAVGFHAHTKLLGLDLKTQISHMQQDRDAPNSFYTWKSNQDVNWSNWLGTAQEGGYGDVLTKTDKITLKVSKDITFEHANIEVGSNIQRSSSYYKRAQNLYSYYDALFVRNARCLVWQSSGCNDSQLLRSRDVFPADEVRVDMINLSGFLEPRFVFGNFDLNLGIRYDFDDFLQNHNFSPRLHTSYKFFDSIILGVGFNRYYKSALLSYKLREAQRPKFTQYRQIQSGSLLVQEWELKAGSDPIRYNFNGAKTPYSDEVALSANKEFQNIDIHLGYVQREFKDEFSRKLIDYQSDGYRYYLMQNKGHSHHEAINLGIKYAQDDFYARLNISKTKTTTSNETYDNEVNEVMENRLVFYDGKVVKYKDLDRLRKDFAREFVANLNLSYSFGILGIDFNTNFLGKQPYIFRTGEQIDRPDGSFDEYKKDYKHEVSISDLRLDLKFSKPHVQLTMEVNNIFNQRSYSVSDIHGGIEIGRNYSALVRVFF